MNSASASSRGGPRPNARVLVISMSFAPCADVGGKRFNYLSKYLSNRLADYHVLARREKDAFEDSTAFRGNVHRVSAFPHFPPGRGNVIKRKLLRIWARWLCPIDPHFGWVLPATIRGIQLCRRNQLNTVVVTVPYFSALIAATTIARLTRSKLIIDYRDEWTNFWSKSYGPIGRFLYPRIERTAIRQASAAVLCTDIMKCDFLKAFGKIAPRQLEVIFNGFEFDEEKGTDVFQNGLTNMVYAGNFHGKRRLAAIAPVLSMMIAAKKISGHTFRFHLYSKLNIDDQSTISRFGLGSIIEVHEPVPYDTIKKIMKASDILFLPSGDEVRYAVPFKFFDYLSARRPILAVASTQSTVNQLMRTIDCGEFAEFGDMTAIEKSLTTLLRQEKTYSFSGADEYRWSRAADRYVDFIDRVIQD